MLQHTDALPFDTMNKGELLARALSAQSAFNKVTGQNTRWTHKRGELAGYFFILERIEGPIDFGNGPTLTLVMTDGDGILYACPASCSSGQWQGLAAPEVIEYVNAGGKPLIRWDKSTSKTGQEFYLLNVVWSPSEDEYATLPVSASAYERVDRA